MNGLKWMMKERMKEWKKEKEKVYQIKSENFDC